MTAFLFPGLGSQYKGMGRPLFDQYQELVTTADEILGYSVKNLCIDDPLKKLGNYQFAQPALFVVNVLSYLKKIEDTGKIPDYIAGHSLGEYNALWAADVFDFETGLKLVLKNTEIINQTTDGRMAAIIGLNESQIKEVLHDNDLKTLDIAIYNSQTQVVIGGPKNDIERGRKIFEAAKAKMYIILNINCAFHTRYMNCLKDQFEDFLNIFKFSKPNIPVVSNVSATPYRYLDIKSNLVNQIRFPVRWFDSIRYLLNKSETNFEEIGPGKVLSVLLKKIKDNE